MDSEKYTRNVSLQCPTCGNTQFSAATKGPVDIDTCASCGRKLTREELLRENSENISEHVGEIKDQIVKDLGKELKSTLARALKGNKHMRIK